jgi:hypothetical protein
MPFTFAHPAVILPFGKVFKNQLSVTGLVMGSMAPDFEYFFRMRMVSIYSHTWQGLIWFDVPLAYILTILYELYIKDKLIMHLPAGLNRRFFWFRGFRTYYSLQYFLAILFSVFIGAISHIVWDGFTHPGGMFLHRVPYLSHLVTLHGHRLYIFTILQHGSTLTGAIIIAAVCLALPKGDLTKTKHIGAFWLQVILVVIVTVAIKLAAGLQLHQYGEVIVTVIDGALLGLIAAALVANDQ